ncbi:MAG: tRNA pseudouridine(13) synthase TruD [Fibrobacterales bacterium]
MSEEPYYTYSDEWNYAESKPETSGVIKTRPEDFKVAENLGFSPEGTGEHFCLYITKRECNTVDVAQALAAYFDVKIMDVGYSGLKDKKAVTSQWMSVYAPRYTKSVAREKLSKFITENKGVKALGGSVVVESITNHTKKLKKGIHASNHFTITIQEFKGSIEDFIDRINRIERDGVPNYFGPQRFGNGGINIIRAQQLFDGSLRSNSKKLRGLYLSAARSLLFNAVLSKRIADKSWNAILFGERCTFETSNAVFTAEDVDDDIIERLKNWDIHPTGPLFGEESGNLDERVAEYEQGVLEAYGAFTEGLLQQDMRADRRALRLKVSDLSFSVNEEGHIVLECTLVRGAFATSVLRELCIVSEPPRQNGPK